MKNIIFFFVGHDNSYRLHHLKENINSFNASFEFVDVDQLSLNIKDIATTSFVKKNCQNIGYFIGNFYKSNYIMQMFSNDILFPQMTGWNLSDKFNAAIFFHKNNILTPTTALIGTHQTLQQTIISVGGFPCIIKRTTGSGGNFVEIVNNENEILNFIQKLSKNITPKSIFPRTFSFVLQQPLKKSYGTDYRALCINNEVLGIIKRTAQGNSFKANVSLGGKAELVDNITEIEKLSNQIMRKSNLFMAGIDFIKDNDVYYAIEINTSPQIKGFEQTTNINISKKIIETLLNLPSNSIS